MWVFVHHSDRNEAHLDNQIIQYDVNDSNKKHPKQKPTKQQQITIIIIMEHSFFLQQQIIIIQQINNLTKQQQQQQQKIMTMMRIKSSKVEINIRNHYFFV